MWVVFAIYSIILESDANVIAGRVAMRGADADVPLSEQVSPGTCNTSVVSVLTCYDQLRLVTIDCN